MVSILKSALLGYKIHGVFFIANHAMTGPSAHCKAVLVRHRAFAISVSLEYWIRGVVVSGFSMCGRPRVPSILQ